MPEFWANTTLSSLDKDTRWLPPVAAMHDFAAPGTGLLFPGRSMEAARISAMEPGTNPLAHSWDLANALLEMLSATLLPGCRLPLGPLSSSLPARNGTQESSS